MQRLFESGIQPHAVQGLSYYLRASYCLRATRRSRRIHALSVPSSTLQRRNRALQRLVRVFPVDKDRLPEIWEL